MILGRYQSIKTGSKIPLVQVHVKIGAELADIDDLVEKKGP